MSHAAEIHVPSELWATSLMPEGILERWLFADGSLVEAGDAVAAVRIEAALHELAAPCSGRLHIVRARNCVIEPGTVIGQISREA